MKSTLFTLLALIACITLRAQSDKKTIVSIETRTVTGAELNKLLNVKITDPKIYDRTGKIIDSAEAIKMVKSFKYQLGWSEIPGMDGIKKTITKIDPVLQAEIDKRTKETSRPKSPKLQEGVILDLKPLSKLIDVAEFKDKAVLLIFWCKQCYDGTKANAYGSLNEVLTSFMNPEKLEIVAITHHDVNEAAPALFKSPIINTRQLVQAGAVIDAYETDRRPIIVLTDRDHKILYAVKDNAMMTPRVLNGIFKEIL